MNNRKHRLLIAASLIILLNPCIRAAADAPDFKIKIEAVHKSSHEELNKGEFWFHPYLAAIPGKGNGGLPAVVLATQKHFKASDHYSPTFVMGTNDLGKTWAGPTAVPQLKWKAEEGYDLAVFSIVPNWHSQTKKVLAIGHSCLYNSAGQYDFNKTGETWVFYTIYDPQTDQWTDWSPLGTRGEGAHCTAAGCDQWLIEADGTILLPVYLQPSPGAAWGVQVWRCRFDGQRLSLIAKGKYMERPGSRGIHEPSLTKFGGRYWLTIRSDDTALVTTSENGLDYEPLVEWTFDDGKKLGSVNTQQHWVTHSDGLFLAYTRCGADNADIARCRAPLFIAQVDTEKKAVLRGTERILLPNRGVPMGNFGVNRVTENETWVSVGENMYDYGKGEITKRGAQGAILIARIVWSKPNLETP